MRYQGFWSRYVVCFCAVTTGICIAEGLMGEFLFPEITLHFGAYLVPPAFGLLTSLTGLVVESRKELSVKQMLFRMFLQLILIEIMVFGINLLVGSRYTPKLAVAVMLEIAVIFVFVYFIMWRNERRVAGAFNKRLAQWQKEQSK